MPGIRAAGRGEGGKWRKDATSRARILPCFLVRGILALVVGVVAGACSVGQGAGEIGGVVHDTLCEVEEPDYQLDPTFFSADVVEDRGDSAGEIARGLSMRIQRGSFREGDSDGLLVLVRDANEIARASLGTPIEITGTADSPVQLTLYLNQTCESGFPDEFWQIPLVIGAHAGTITFDAIYAPDIASDETEISATLTDVLFVDPERPTERFALFSGTFRFFYQRGRPAQLFP